MRAYTFREYIDRSPRQVWDILVNLDVAARWRPLVKSMETEDGLPVHDGSRVRFTIEYLGQQRTHTSITVAFEPPRRWTLRSSNSPKMEGYFEFLVEPRGAGTEVVSTLDLKAHGFVPWLFMPLIGRGEKQRRAEMLGNLKRYVESTIPRA
jgi:carbon monoxide dehydrogenase subunit G